MTKKLKTMTGNIDSLIKDLEKEASKIKAETKVYEKGEVETVGDGIATVKGLPNVEYYELLSFPHNVFGLAFNLEEEKIGVIVLGDFKKLKEGDEVKGTSRTLSVPVSEKLLGRVIDPLAMPLDGKPEVKTKKAYPMEKIAPGVIKRQPVDTPLQTGIKAVDSMIPIGRGQRELIIGDRGTGKTAVAIDTIINQKNQNVICIYVAIGQKQSRIAQIQEKLSETGSMDYSIIVSASASQSAALQYLAPYAGCAIAEYFMDKGKDVLIVYDDLSKHAWAYRQLSLLLKRPSGREAYPGDIFYLHSRLLERACHLDKEYGGGSITALPIIETQAGDLSAYIPTNVISITDGQIYLEPDLFFAGVRPAINVGLSVSRVGGSAQIKAMKKIAGQLRIELAQFRELAAFTQFSTDLDPETKAKIDRGSRISELFKQPQYQPVPVENQVLAIWVITKGFADEIPDNLIKKYEDKLIDYFANKEKKILAEIKKEKQISDRLAKKMEKEVKRFTQAFIKTESLDKKAQLEEEEEDGQ
jgi:F-type H+/Na+-transporting ATPase subunit alpha